MSISIILYNCCGQIINQNKYWSHLLIKEHELNNKLSSIYEEEYNKINNKSRKIINRIYKKNEYINELKKNNKNMNEIEQEMKLLDKMIDDYLNYKKEYNDYNKKII